MERDDSNLSALHKEGCESHCAAVFIAKLPAFHLYDIQNKVHSSSDDQRMETQIDTINARHSPKYFGSLVARYADPSF